MTSEVKHLTGRELRRQIEALERISAQEKVDRSAALRRVLDIGLQQYMKRKGVDRQGSRGRRHIHGRVL